MGDCLFFPLGPPLQGKLSSRDFILLLTFPVILLFGEPAIGAYKRFLNFFEFDSFGSPSPRALKLLTAIPDYFDPADLRSRSLLELSPDNVLDFIFPFMMYFISSPF